MTGSMIRALLLLASAKEAFSSCAYGTFLKPRAEQGNVPVSTFGYTGVTGPLNWAALDAANRVCMTGTHQSPIDMVDGAFKEVPARELCLDVPNFLGGAEFENLGTTVEVVAPGGKLSFGGKSFALRQFHFHLPSEHLDNGTSHAMEMHMVWQSETKELAVIGLYIDVEVFPTLLLESVFSVIDRIATPGTKVKTPPLFMSEIVSKLKAGSFQSYKGSLTTPPCSEGVNWFVSTAKLAISPATFAKVRDVIGFNSRYTQNTPGQPNLLQLAASWLNQNQTA